MNAIFQPGIDHWDFSGSWRERRVTPVMLARGAAISTALAAVAEAARQRIASIPDDGAEDHTAES
jgi:hypothetical protein